MLVLTRRIGEENVIADNIGVTIVAVDGQKVRLGITAPPSISVDREEVHARRRAPRISPASTSHNPTATETGP